MKPIRIADRNAGPIEEALFAVNKKHFEHAFTTYYDVWERVGKAEIRLGELIPAVKRHVGARACCISGAPVAKAYKYRRTGTRLLLERRATGWFLVGVEPVNLWQRDGGSVTLYLAPEQDAIAVANFRTKYQIRTGG